MDGLKTAFPYKDLKWRIIKAGSISGDPWAKVFTYLDARTVMDRLDEVVGITRWQDTYTVRDDNIICRLGIQVGEDWIWKEDSASKTEVDPLKGGFSTAFKRAAVKWGVGRYLYKLPTLFADFSEVRPYQEGARPVEIEGVRHWWVPPHKLPMWALCEKEQKARRAVTRTKEKENGKEKVNRGAVASKKQKRGKLHVGKDQRSTDHHIQKQVQGKGQST